MLAVPGVGATLSPINQSLNAHEMETQMIMVRTKFVITTEECLPVVTEAIAGSGGVVKVVLVRGDRRKLNLSDDCAVLKYGMMMLG